MANYKTFLEVNGTKNFDELPLCEVDIGILALLSYADFVNTPFYNEETKNSLISLNTLLKSNYYNTFSKNYLSMDKSFENFIKVFLNSPRYKDIEFGLFKNKFSTKNIVQFFALTYKIDDYYVVCFRGTDNTINGFKEDMLMTLYDEIPAQKLAVRYLKNIIKLFNKNIIVAGHSKGGNLAYYSYFNLSKSFKKKIFKIYNFDGPGFKNDNFDYSEYGKKLIKFVPEDDIVGTFFDTSNNMEVVRSTKISIFAHDMLSWSLDKNTSYSTFKRANKLTMYAFTFRDTFNSWCNSFNNEEIEDFIYFVFEVSKANNAFTVGALAKDLIFSTNVYSNVIKSYDEEKKSRVIDMSKKFFRLYISNLFNRKNKK